MSLKPTPIVLFRRRLAREPKIYDPLASFILWSIVVHDDTLSDVLACSRA
jgi:hypothetical protein